MSYGNLEKFDGLVGQEFDFFGVCSNEFKLDDCVWEALEDEDDGYRSYLGSVERKNSSGIFFRQSLGRVRLISVDKDDMDLYVLEDVLDGHRWLSFGTDNSCDYYPCFVFEYQPKAPVVG